MLAKMLSKTVVLRSPSINGIRKNIIRRNVSNSRTTADTSEINQFKQFSKSWWDEDSPIKPLHSMNKLRIPLIRDGLINTNAVATENINTPTPLKSLSILDVGCGGGILSEPLARLGGDVVGLDATCDVIDTAKAHAIAEKLQNVQYTCSTIEEHASTNAEKYDVVVASEVIEHVTQKEDFLKACLHCLKPGGSIFLTTISQTYIANIGAIFFVENVLKIVPKGTHEYDKFITAHRLQRMLEDENCKTILVHGFIYNFLTDEWAWTSFADVNYAIHAVKLLNK